MVRAKTTVLEVRGLFTYQRDRGIRGIGYDGNDVIIDGLHLQLVSRDGVLESINFQRPVSFYSLNRLNSVTLQPQRLLLCRFITRAANIAILHDLIYLYSQASILSRLVHFPQRPNQLKFPLYSLICILKIPSHHSPRQSRSCHVYKVLDVGLRNLLREEACKVIFLDGYQLNFFASYFFNCRFDVQRTVVLGTE